MSSNERSRALAAVWQRQRLRSYIAASGAGLAFSLAFSSRSLATATLVAAVAAVALLVGDGRYGVVASIVADSVIVAALLAVLVAPPPAVAFYIGYYVVVVMVLRLRSAVPLLAAVVTLAGGILFVPEWLGLAIDGSQASAIGVTAAVVFTLNTGVLLAAVDREMRRFDRTTERRVEFSAAIAAGAKRLLSGSGGDGLEATVRILAEAIDAGSVFVERNVDDPDLGPCTTLVATCDRGYADPVPPQHWEMVPWSDYPEAYRRLSAGEHFAFRVAELTGREREMYAGTGIGSEIDVPIVVDGRWLGMIGVNVVHPDAGWTREDVALLWSLADMIGASWQREEEAQVRQALIDSLDDSLRYERAMAACSRALLGGVEGGIEAALAALIDATGAEFAFVDVNVEHVELGLCAVLVAESIRPGYEEHILADGWQDPTAVNPTPDLIPYTSMPTVHRALAAGEVAHIVTSDLEEGVERTIYERGKVLSELCIPFFVDGRWHGSIGFTQFTEMRAWDRRELDILRTAAEMVGVAFERQEVKRRLEALLESKDELIAGVSHELRTPLTVVVGLSEELAANGDFESAEARALMRMVASQSREMADIVEDLLVAARADDGSVAVVPESVDLAALAEGVVSYLSVPADRTLLVRGDAAEAWADPGRVRQIVRNLVTNAIRYGGDEITVSVGRAVNAVLEVIDTGPGVPDDSVAVVFEPYQRAHNRPTQPSSVGLGLTLSRRLARLMGGDLEYVPRDGLCVFRLTLPAAARPTAQAARAAVAVPGAAG